MFERLITLVKRYALIEGVAIGIVATIGFYERFRLDNVKDSFEAANRSANAQLAEVKTRYEITKDQLTHAEQLRSQLHEAQLEKKTVDVQLQVAESDLAAAKTAYNGLLSMKWDEKYRMEKLAKETAESELAATKLLYNGQPSMKWEEKFRAEKLAREAAEDEITSLRDKLAHAQTGAISSADEALTLKAKLTAVEEERDSLRRLYTGPTVRLKESSATSNPRTESRSAEILFASLSNVSVLDAADMLIEMIPNVEGGVAAPIFIRALKRASSLDRGRVVEACAKYIHRPISADDITEITKLLAVFDVPRAVKELGKYSR